MGTLDRRYWIVFNGEIYNYLELQKELEALGYSFVSRSDTEVLLAAYAAWGVQALLRLVGMFAFAILDVQRRKVFLARDFFGVKPLYYTYWRGGFLFASEIKALLELPGVSREVNPQRLYDYLKSGITDYGGETFFKEIKQLSAAHYIEVSLDHPQGAQPVRYWQIDLTQRTELSFDETVVRLRELFLENISLHLRSDVPVGAALSGGIDSSSIVMAMRYLNRHLDIHTFSYVPDDSRLSEEHWVDIVSTESHAIVHKTKPNPNELVADLEKLIDVQGEPFISTSMYAQCRVFQLAHEAGIKVMLDGQGADELLGGYYDYIIARIGSMLRQGQWVEAMQLSYNCSRLPGTGISWLLPRIMGFSVPSPLYKPLQRWLKRDLTPSWLNLSWFNERGVAAQSPSYRGGKALLKEDLCRTLTETSLPCLLRYEDRNSMAFSIESRVPFLTPALVTFIFTLPEEYLISQDATTKAVFRKALRGIVPDVILNRRDKIGFLTPEKDWLFGLSAWVEQVLTSETARHILAIDPQEVRREWNEMLAGHRSFNSWMWRLVNMVMWMQICAVHLE
jgi:asparagine synthase (glutamine-hydrolysing)